MRYQVKQELTQGDIEAFYSAQGRLEEEQRTTRPADMLNALAAFHKQAVKLEPRPSQPEYNALLAEYAGSLRAVAQRGNLSAPVQRGVVLRAALEAGILSGVDSVADLQPWLAAQIENAISEAIVAAFTVPNA